MSDERLIRLSDKTIQDLAQAVIKEKEIREHTKAAQAVPPMDDTDTDQIKDFIEATQLLAQLVKLSA